MSTHTHRPRAVHPIEDADRAYKLAVCPCGQVARIRSWSEDVTPGLRGKYELIWEAEEGWRPPNHQDQQEQGQFQSEL